MPLSLSAQLLHFLPPLVPPFLSLVLSSHRFRAPFAPVKLGPLKPGGSSLRQLGIDPIRNPIASETLSLTRGVNPTQFREESQGRKDSVAFCRLYLQSCVDTPLFIRLW